MGRKTGSGALSVLLVATISKPNTSQTLAPQLWCTLCCCSWIFPMCLSMERPEVPSALPYLLDKKPSQCSVNIPNSHTNGDSGSLTREFLLGFWSEDFVQSPDLLQFFLLHQHTDDPLAHKPSCSCHQAVPSRHGQHSKQITVEAGMM